MKVCGVEFTLISCGCSKVTDKKEEHISQHSSFFGRILKVSISEFEIRILPLSTVGFVQEFIGCLNKYPK